MSATPLILPYRGASPRIAPDAYVADNAVITGDVVVASGASVWFGVIIRADSWQNRELLLHQLVHIAQCERSGGIESFVVEYLCDRRTCRDFSVGSLEDEARGLAREICAADKATKQLA